MEVGNITKASTFKSFLHLSHKNTQLHFCDSSLLVVFMRQTLTDDFWGLHKNMNCTVPLTNSCTEIVFQCEYFQIVVRKTKSVKLKV